MEAAAGSPNNKPANRNCGKYYASVSSYSIWRQKLQMAKTGCSFIYVTQME